MRTLILLRHGESEGNAQQVFTGWLDVDLTNTGKQQGRSAGALLHAAGLRPDCAHTSALRRAQHTCELALTSAGRPDAHVTRTWRLNERHYGALQGRNKADVLREFGEERFHTWRRSYEVAPPATIAAARRGTPDAVPEPSTESLADVHQRLLPHWESALAPALRPEGSTVLVVGHSNSLRALVTHLDTLDTTEVRGLHVPIGAPLVYQLDDALVPLHRGGRYLDPVAAAEGVRAVAREGLGEPSV